VLNTIRNLFKKQTQVNAQKTLNSSNYTFQKKSVNLHISASTRL